MVIGFVYYVVVKFVDYLLLRILVSMLKIIYLLVVSSVNVNVCNFFLCFYEGLIKYLNNMFFLMLYRLF